MHISEAVRQRGWTNAELARRLELPPQTTHRWLKGERRPRRRDDLRRLIELFGGLITIEDLMIENPPPANPTDAAA